MLRHPEPLMIFKSLCRDAEIGANSYLLQGERVRIVLDAGMHPKAEGADAIPRFEWLDDGTVDMTGPFAYVCSGTLRLDETGLVTSAP